MPALLTTASSRSGSSAVERGDLLVVGDVELQRVDPPAGRLGDSASPSSAWRTVA